VPLAEIIQNLSRPAKGTHITVPLCIINECKEMADILFSMANLAVLNAFLQVVDKESCCFL